MVLTVLEVNFRMNSCFLGKPRLKKSLWKTGIVFWDLQSCFTDFAWLWSQDSPGTLIIGYSKQYPVRTKMARVALFFRRTYHCIRDFSTRNLFYPKDNFCVTINKYTSARLLGFRSQKFLPAVRQSNIHLGGTLFL